MIDGRIVALRLGHQRVDVDLSFLRRRGEAAGYPRKYGYYEAFSPGYYEVTVEIGDILVELHRSFAQRVRAAIDYDGLWSRRERFERDGVSGYRMSPADAILAHAFSLSKDEFSSELSRFLDFYLLLQQHDGELVTCVARAKAWQIERSLFGALHITTTLFPGARTAAVNEAMNALLDGETAEALSMLRDLVHAEIMFKELARQTGLGEKRLHRMLSHSGNPTTRHLGLILKSIAEDLGIKPRVAATVS